MTAVVVTGLGHCGPAGDVAGLARALQSGRCERTTLDSPHDRAGGSRQALLTKPQAHRDAIEPAALRRMSPLSRHAVAASRAAAASARLPAAPDGEGTSVVMATTFAAISQSEEILRAALSAEGPSSISPSIFTESVANAPAAQLGIDRGARGSSVTITQGPAGALIAVARAAADVRRARVRRALAGAVDEMTPFAHACLDRLGALAHVDAAKGTAETARPFCPRRTGYVVSDGASVVVVEAERAARGRDAPILARIAGAGSAFDPTASRTSWGREPARAARALGDSLRAAGWQAGDLELVVSGASGSVPGDAWDAAWLEAALGDARPPIVAPKGIVGEHGGSFLAAALLAVTGHAVAPTDFDHGGPGPVPAIAPESAMIRLLPARSLVMTSSAGGAVAWLLLERP